MTLSDTGADIQRKYRLALDAYGKRNPSEAAAILGQLIAENALYAEAHHLLGICLYESRNFAEAEQSIRKALTIAERPDFYANLGLVLLCAGNLPAAAESYQHSLRMEPRSADVCNNLANILLSSRRFEDAADLYSRAVEIAPNFAVAYYNLGSCLFRLGRNAEAEASLRQAIAINPGYVDARRRLADMLTETQRFDEAYELYKSIGAWGWLQFAMRSNVSWIGLASVDATYLRELETGIAHPVSPWCLIQMSGMTPALEKQAAHDFIAKGLKELRESPLKLSNTPIETNRCLRIGYISADFYTHATMYLIAGVLEEHNRKVCDIVIFSYGPQRDDECARRLHATGLPIVDVSEMSDREAAQQIADRQIDILVDLKGHTGGARLGISALRPAPIIVSWLGYPGTLGHERLADYIIGDAIVTPPEDVPFYSERLALMPYSYQPNDGSRVFPTPPTRAQAGLPEFGFVFCSFNQAVKFNPETFDLWARLLLAVPGSVLWLLQPSSPSCLTNIGKEFRARNIPASRVIFAPPVSQAEHISRLRLADLALDTFPCTSHTTASDALWSEVPLVTLKGNTFSSRVAASVLTTHGFPELVVETRDAYFELSLELATDAARRESLRERLRHARRTSPLFDTVRFTKDLEKLYGAIVANHQLPPVDRPRIVTIK